MLRWKIAIQRYRLNIKIVHKERNLHKNADEIRRWELSNTPYNPAYVPLEAEPQIPMQGINITDIGTELFKEIRESYKKVRNFNILTSLLDKELKDTALVNLLDEILETSYSEGILHFFDGIIYDRTKY
ncbi:hypothetical protein O181_094073 [Austropuccinia psidii MF-1]|uniref:Uncharacterized protein n=1 Tax=Austropuccinia psidii MF-1 TaxID=1389203 RepID=A0A9Q3P9Y1_9BASI|nr:hypothetical protein [Austropuccinia psidii MF-1]